MSDAWTFAAQAWRRPGVAAVALALQDVHGYPPALLLWRLWTLADGRGVGDEAVSRAVEVARAWQRDILDPLRSVRRRLTSPTTALTAVGAAGLRDQVLGAELDAERALLAELESLAGRRRGPRAEPLSALTALAEMWRPPPPTLDLSRLVDLIGAGASGGEGA